MPRLLVLLALALACAAARPSRAAGHPLLDQFLASQRILVLGDSITYSGEYLEFLETWLRIAHPAAQFELLNLGLPSETVSGLSEPGHAGGAFPRPDLHERLARVLAKTRPDLVLVCYGMNDGIYHPFSEERFAAFRSGIVRLREALEGAGAKIVHLTPPVFDPQPLKGHTLGPGLAEYRQPYEGYNQVLDRYSDWLVSRRAQGWQVIDLHQPMNRFLAARRKTDPEFQLAGDGTHANPQGHWLMAREILRELGAPENLTEADDPQALERWSAKAPAVLELVRRRQRLLKDAWLTATGHLRPGMNQGEPLPQAQSQAAQIAAALHQLTNPPAPKPTP